MKIKSILFLLRIVVTLSIITILVWKVDFTGLGVTLKNLNLFFFLSALGLFFSAQVINALRWQVILNGLEIDVSLNRLIYLNLVGIFFNAFLPTSIGGEAIKTYYLCRLTRESTACVISVIIARVMGTFSILILIGFGVWGYYYYFKSSIIGLPSGINLWLLGTGLTSVILICVWGLSRIQVQSFIARKMGNTKKTSRLLHYKEKILDYSKKLLLSFKTLKRKRKVLWLCLSFSLLFNLTLILVNYLISRALGLEVAFSYFLIFIPLISAFTMLPVSISGIGLRETAYVFLFTRVGMTPAQALSISLIGYGMVLTLSLLGGIFHLYSPLKTKKV